MDFPIVSNEQSGLSEIKVVKSLENNINSCIAVAELIKSTYGPSGNDKLIFKKESSQTKNFHEKEVFVSNDGASILARLKVEHPAASILVDLAKSQVIFVIS
jgi:T-complex protein 1 subunit eta